MDLSGLNLVQLRQLQQEVIQTIKAREREEKNRAREQILDIAQRAGIPLTDLFGGAKIGANGRPHANTGVKVAAKYRHPDIPSLAWTGRGRSPAWVMQLLEDGYSLSQLAVKAEKQS